MKDYDYHFDMLYRLFCDLCARHIALVNSRTGNQYTWGIFPENCLSGCTFNKCKLPHQLYITGNGQRGTIRNSHVFKTGSSQYSAVDYHEYPVWTVWHDLDTACGRSDHVAGITWFVFPYISSAAQ